MAGYGGGIVFAVRLRSTAQPGSRKSAGWPDLHVERQHPPARASGRGPRGGHGFVSASRHRGTLEKVPSTGTAIETVAERSAESGKSALSQMADAAAIRSAIWRK